MQSASRKRQPLNSRIDYLDWVLGELDHAIDAAKKRGLLLYQCDPDLAQAASAFFRHYHQRLDFSQARPDFDSVRISDEEWNLLFRQKIQRIIAGPSAKPSGVGPLSDTTR